MLAGAIDANQVALLRDGRIGLDFMQVTLAAFFGPGIGLDFAVNANLAWRTGGDVGVSAAAGEFQANGTIDRESLVEGAFGAGTRAASGEEHGSDSCRCREYCELCRASDTRCCELVILVAGMVARAIGARARASFLSEIYEEVQPEVPRGSRTGESKAPGASRKARDAPAATPATAHATVAAVAICGVNLFHFQQGIEGALAIAFQI